LTTPARLSPSPPRKLACFFNFFISKNLLSELIPFQCYPCPASVLFTMPLRTRSPVAHESGDAVVPFDPVNPMIWPPSLSGHDARDAPVLSCNLLHCFLPLRSAPQAKLRGCLTFLWRASRDPTLFSLPPSTFFSDDRWELSAFASPRPSYFFQFRRSSHVRFRCSVPAPDGPSTRFLFWLRVLFPLCRFD